MGTAHGDTFLGPFILNFKAQMFRDNFLSSLLKCLSMFVGAICHDLDHRGFNNKFMIDIASPLAAIYSTSTMEHHHFNMTVVILQQVLSKMWLSKLFFCIHFIDRKTTTFLPN